MREKIEKWLNEESERLKKEFLLDFSHLLDCLEDKIPKKYSIKLVNNIIPSLENVLKDYGTFDDESKAIEIAKQEYGKDIYYTRRTLISDNKYTIDYGDYCKFILVEVINE